MSAATPLAAQFQDVTQAMVDISGRALASRGAQDIASDDIERALTAIVKLYAAKAETEGIAPAPVSAARVTPTEVVFIVSEMLRAVDVSLFDLAMWYRRGQPA
jgi:hypothetical protein